MKVASRIVLLLLTLVLVFSVGGAYAVWLYAGDPVSSQSDSLGFKLGDFLWDGSGDLPTEGTIGENHLTLIDAIINHPDHGLNTSKSYLNEQIDDRQDGGIGWSGGRDTLGSMAVTQSEELSEIFGLKASNLNFLIQFIDGDTYYLFTTGEYLGERGEINWLGQTSKAGNPTVPIGGNVAPIYKTVVEKVNGRWTAISTTKGYAKSAWYEESRRNANATQIPSFDPDTFTEGDPA